MFAAIAPRYDLNNRLHSLGRDQAWRRAAVRLARVRPGDRVVDVACGTGDLTLLFANKLAEVTPTAAAGGYARHQGGENEAEIPAVIGIDYTYPMLPLARHKAQAVADDRPSLRRPIDPPPANPKSPVHKIPVPEAPDPRPTHHRPSDDRPTHPHHPAREKHPFHPAFINGDAQALPLPDACCDVLSIAFGIRNVQSIPAALAEFARVLRPGGRLVILEFTRPRNRIVRFCNDLYCSRVMPHTATWLSGDTSGAYKYLPISVATFIDRPEMCRLIRAAGFGPVDETGMMLGTCCCYVSTRE